MEDGLRSRRRGTISNMPLIEDYELPPWYQRTQLITSDYRNPNNFSTPLACMKSVFMWHNETLNIHTHLWMGIFMPLLLYLSVKDESFENTSIYYKTSVIVGFLGPAIMGFASAFAHTFYIINKDWFDICWKIDIIGIVAVLFAHYMAVSYFIFYLLLNTLYGYYISIIIGASSGLLCIYKVFADIKNLEIYSIIYGFIGSVPLPLTLLYYAYFSSYTYGIDKIIIQTVANQSLGCSACCGVACFVFFLGKIPERFLPSFPIKSHTFHHIFINLGVFSALCMIPHIQRIDREKLILA